MEHEKVKEGDDITGTPSRLMRHYPAQSCVCESFRFLQKVFSFFLCFFGVSCDSISRHIPFVHFIFLNSSAGTDRSPTPSGQI